MEGVDIARPKRFLDATMSTETNGGTPEPETKTTQVELPKTHFCQRCGSESDGLANCLHVQSTVGSEIRCLTCYRDFVQSETHLEAIKKHIPIMVRLPRTHEKSSA